MNTHQFDILIIGAGPAGLSCAMKLHGSGLSVAILDKAEFPRDKICGDALSLDVINQLPFLSPNLVNAFESFPEKKSSYGVRVFSPDHQHIDIPFLHKGIEKCGFTCKRKDFDNLLFQEVKQMNHCTVFENCNVKNITKISSGFQAVTSESIFMCKMIIGADGAYSVVSRKLNKFKLDPKNYCSGLRMYFENVDPVNNKNFIELYFLKNVLPGYVWIFPLAGNKANVGIGMLSSVIIKKKINLRKLFNTCISENKLLKERLKNAIPIEIPQAYTLPLGTEKRIISGEHFLLLGDAAGLIDPFTGEGVANAIRSGRVAAEHLINCFNQNNFSASFNKAYDSEIYHRMWKEFKVSNTLQKLSKYETLFNFVVKKANLSKKLRQFLIEGMADVDKKGELIKQIVLYKMIMKK